MDNAVSQSHPISDGLVAATSGSEPSAALLDALGAAAKRHLEQSNNPKLKEWQRKAHAHQYGGILEAMTVVGQSVEPRGHRHTRLLITIHDELLAQHPGAFFEEDDTHLVIPASATGFVKIDTSSLAEALLGPAQDTSERLVRPGDELKEGTGSSRAESGSTASPKSDSDGGH